jgi:hypothetical protein
VSHCAANSRLRGSGYSSDAQEYGFIVELSTKPSTLDDVCFYLFQWDARLFAAGFGDQAVPKILKPGSVFFQVDENCYFSAFAIGYELDSSHGFILHASPSRRAFYWVAEILTIQAVEPQAEISSSSL